MDTERRLDAALLLSDLQDNAFAPSDGPPRVGLEVEMLAVRDNAAVPISDLLAAIDPLIGLGELADVTVAGSPPCYSYGSTRLTFEPGGQLEVISAPHSTLADALADVSKLEMLLDRVLGWRGIRRVHAGINPWQQSSDVALQTPLPRYKAMHEYFAAIGPGGARMMRLCCSLQINIDLGSPEQAARRWRLANLMSPLLTGIFANSPVAGGMRADRKSARACVWRDVDLSRTGAHFGADGPTDYLDFALDAGLMGRRTPSDYRPGRPDTSFRDWMERGDDAGYPTLDDWHYHLTTLFPQVRPRGFLELRAIDAPAARWRAVPVAVATTLLLDDAACADATGLLEPLVPHMDDIERLSAVCGLDDPNVAALAQSLMRTAIDAIPRLAEGWCSPSIAADVAAFNERFTARGRCPADDWFGEDGAWRA
ncbi:MAG: glutamate--cysteine ligase [Chloroflexi bacterium]|nr:glutamate--cysteine ligase [Chloroflexota bacterium]